jgi:hypothetical protein
MASVIKHILEDISVREEGGAVAELVTTYHVTGLSDNGEKTVIDALASCPGYNTSPSGMPHLRLVQRTARMLDNSNQDARVTLTYRPLGQDGFNFVFRGGTTAGQTETNQDANGNALVVHYTYPDPYPYNPNLSGQTDTQMATVTVFLPQSTLMADCVTQVDQPLYWSEFFSGGVNAFTWNGGAPHTWMCTRCDFEPWDLSTDPPTWKFDFEFQRKLDTWDQFYFWVDPNTGRPPSDLVAGVGIKQAPFMKEVHFAMYIRNL